MASDSASDGGDLGNGGFGCFGSFGCARRNFVAVVVVEPKRRGVPARFRAGEQKGHCCRRVIEVSQAVKNIVADVEKDCRNPF